MSDKIAFFPLNLVVFPGEKLNLHIFEPRYKQLIKDCINQEIEFGIPTYLDGSIKRFGTLMRIESIVNEYPDGRMDISTIGTRIFRAQEFINPIENKLYSGGKVIWVEDNDFVDDASKRKLVKDARELFELMGIEVEVDDSQPYLSYKLGHKVGLSTSQEYQLLTLENEKSRVDFLLDFIERALPYIKEVERTKLRVKMNGHFKNLDPLKF
ncbi:LON peptidase substrate-binding domain-containing protein [Sediminitomix flava]|uniref:Lon N-terminal domain-containing protein n=1 Tax=Sediminitomix flava TaxID=379075 RepID=A0A315ZCS9_SEDFL|nr:LON peptidase substrate-binding domain-containing protein [Sediminitomix flava]PWJ43386.1 hypothetical protein BC781_102947 [Sediminitomix flava]